MIKAAVIGAGAMGRNHVRVYAEMENVSLVGVADPDETTAHKATRVYQTRTYADYRRMLDEERPEIVSIAVPTEFHAEVAEEAMGRGIHVLVEKPLALTAEEGRAIIAGARRHGVKLMMGHIERFNPAIAEIKSRLGRQELGRVFQIVARRLSRSPRASATSA
jgi:UDP-N-acetylglucosamine 3-dehydrogenase